MKKIKKERMIGLLKKDIKENKREISDLDKKINDLYLQSPMGKITGTIAFCTVPWIIFTLLGKVLFSLNIIGLSIYPLFTVIPTIISCVIVNKIIERKHNVKKYNLSGEKLLKEEIISKAKKEQLSSYNNCLEKVCSNIENKDMDQLSFDNDVLKMIDETKTELDKTVAEKTLYNEFLDYYLKKPKVLIDVFDSLLISSIFSAIMFLLPFAIIKTVPTTLSLVATGASALYLTSLKVADSIKRKKLYKSSIINGDGYDINIIGTKQKQISDLTNKFVNNMEKSYKVEEVKEETKTPIEEDIIDEARYVPSRPKEYTLQNKSQKDMH